MNMTLGLTMAYCETTSISEVCMLATCEGPNNHLITLLGIVQSLQHLHDELKEYRAPQIVRPNIESLQSESQSSFFGGLFRRKGTRWSTTNIPKALPKGLYLFGDVGSGKTMLMDMFYETLPYNIASKTRIHFHNFIQDVHKRLYAMKKQYGTDFDAIPFIGADIAERGSVLCFDEFQVTDVADAMILRRLVFKPGCCEDNSKFALANTLLSFPADS
jgi:protein AFG1